MCAMLKEPQSLVRVLLFAAKFVIPEKTFLDCFCNPLSKTNKFLY